MTKEGEAVINVYGCSPLQDVVVGKPINNGSGFLGILRHWHTTQKILETVGKVAAPVNCFVRIVLTQYEVYSRFCIPSCNAHP
jgi:hypothetical protein